MSNPKKQGRYHHGDLRQAVIDAALQLIAEQGIESLTLREIAQRVGVSRMAPYRHFENKAVLLAVLAQEGFQALFVHIQATLAKSSSQPLERLQALGVAYIFYAVENPVHYRVMFDASLSNRTLYPPLYETAVKSFDCLVEVLIKCQNAGLIGGGDPKELAQINWSLCHGLAMLLIDQQFITMGHAPVEELANTALKTIIEGLKNSK
ncbi:MAG: TetR/AcrR family transcriptional regulator [Cyanobacteria bacterium J06639_14]